MFNISYFESKDEETKGSKKEEKTRTIFISPFMRYKCVIPMVVDEEAKQREQRQKEKAEEDSRTVRFKDEYVNEAEINESKNRVHQHFKQVSQTIVSNKQVEIPPKKKKKKKKPKQLILSQMQGRKRKREFDNGNENRKKNDGNDFSMTTLTPYLDAGGTVHMSKKAKPEAQKAIEDQKAIQESLAQMQGDNNSETIKSIR